MKMHKIIERINETDDVVSLRLIDSETGAHPKFIAGQYVTILFPDLNVPSGKAYSLSSISSDPFLQITIKKLGVYSSRLHELKVGDEILVSEPYGFLNPEFDTPTVMIAGGVGIVPIMSIIRDTLLRDPKRRIELWFSNRTIDDIVFVKELDDLSAKHKNFCIKHFITQQKKLPPGYELGRINVTKMLSKKNYDSETFFFICGREEFVGSMWHALTNAEISDNKIATETFF